MFSQCQLHQFIVVFDDICIFSMYEIHAVFMLSFAPSAYYIFTCIYTVLMILIDPLFVYSTLPIGFGVVLKDMRVFFIMYPLICCFSGFMIFEPNLACSHSTQAHGIEKDKRSAATRRWIPCTWWREINREIIVNTRCQEKDSILYKFFLYTNMVTVLHCVVQECVLKCLSFCNRNIWKNYLHIYIYIMHKHVLPNV